MAVQCSGDQALLVMPFSEFSYLRFRNQDERDLRRVVVKHSNVPETRYYVYIQGIHFKILRNEMFYQSWSATRTATRCATR